MTTRPHRRSGKLARRIIAGGVALLALGAAGLAGAQEAPAPIPLNGDHAPPSSGQQPEEGLVWGGGGSAAANDVGLQVMMAKASVDEALRNPSAAFDAYLATHIEEYNATLSAGREPSPAQRALAPLISSPAARQGRQAVFATNLRRIAAYNRRSGEDLAYGITGFTHLTSDEFKSAYLAPMGPIKARVGAPAGARLPGAEAGEDGPLGVPYECDSEVPFPYGSTEPPPAKDWRDVGGVSYVTEPRNQASCGSCASFAATAVLESHVAYKYRDAGFDVSNTDLSEQDHMDCTEGDQCQGWLPSYYLDRAVCRGIAFEPEVPYQAKDADVCKPLQRFLTGLKGFATVPGNERAHAQAVNQSPVAIAVAANSAFQFYKGGAFPCASDSTGINHAVTLVGYNDAMTMKSGEKWKVWYIKNSWAKTWGSAGYVMLRKDCVGTGAMKMYTKGYNVIPV